MKTSIKKIEIIRNELNKAVAQKTWDYEKILEISTRLDNLLNKFYIEFQKK